MSREAAERIQFVLRVRLRDRASQKRPVNGLMNSVLEPCFWDRTAV